MRFRHSWPKRRFQTGGPSHPEYLMLLAYTDMAYILMAYVVMVYIVMTYIAMAYSYGL